MCYDEEAAYFLHKVLICIYFKNELKLEEHIFLFMFIITNIVKTF